MIAADLNAALPNVANLMDMSIHCCNECVDVPWIEFMACVLYVVVAFPSTVRLLMSFRQLFIVREENLHTKE